jgi:competence protein ComEC
LDYLKGFYTTTLYFDLVPKEENFKDKIIKKIEQNHTEPLIKELFLAMFLATPISVELRNICTNYAITHLIALSGFHLVAITFLIYWSLYFPYSYVHTRFFPYRNKKFDLLMISTLFLFYYLSFDIIPNKNKNYRK